LEWDTSKEAEKERRVPERREEAPDIAHDENEEHAQMCSMLSPVIGSQKGADQQHGRTGGADEIRSYGAYRKEHCIYEWRACKLALDVDASCNHKESRQEDHKGNIVHEGLFKKAQPVR
jgi:hypothetical protein